MKSMEWHTAAKEYLERLCAAEAKSESYFTRKGKKIVRCHPSPYVESLIEHLNKNDEEGFKATKLAHGRYSALGF